MKKKDNARTFKDIGKKLHAVASCQIYKECETRIPPNNVNQDETSLVILERKESSQQPEMNKIENINFSSTNEGSYLSINEELQLDTSVTQDLNQRDKDKVNNIYIYRFPWGRGINISDPMVRS